MFLPLIARSICGRYLTMSRIVFTYLDISSIASWARATSESCSIIDLLDLSGLDEDRNHVTLVVYAFDRFEDPLVVGQMWG
jgi:hypothetical protein